MVPEDQIRPRRHEARHALLLAWSGVVMILDAPMDAHDHRVGVFAGFRHGRAGRIQVQLADPGLGWAAIQIVVKDVREAQESQLHPIALHIDCLFRFGLGGAGSDGDEPFRPEALEGFHHSLGPLIESMVVGRGKNLKASRFQGCGQFRGPIELIGTARPSGRGGHGGFQIGEGEIRRFPLRCEVGPERSKALLGRGRLHICMHHDVAHGQQRDLGFGGRDLLMGFAPHGETRDAQPRQHHPGLNFHAGFPRANPQGR